jgi:hypothetical protein
MPVIEPIGVWQLGFFSERRKYELDDPPVIRAERVDPMTQEWTSLLMDRDPTDAAVIEALWRVRKSGAAVVNVGARFLDVEKLDDQAPARFAGEARVALRRLVDRGDITIKSITVDTGSDWGEVTVDYVNNRTALQKKDRTVKMRAPEAIKNGQT